MGDLKTQNTSYPTTKDTATLFADLTDQIVAQNQNGPNTAIVAIENELGIGLKGTVADLATRLAVNVGTDGGIVKATSDPPGSGTPAFYYNTVTNKLKILNISSGSWEEFTTAAGLATYVRTDIPNTITAVHTFGTTTDTTSPFLVASATSAVVTNLNADKVDGQHAVLTIGADHTHTATGAMGGIISHTSLTNIGSNTHAQIDTFVSTVTAVLSPARPMFFAKRNSAQVLVTGAIYKVNCDGELFDTNNNYDNSTNYRFTPTVAGYYLFGSVAEFNGAGPITLIMTVFRKNGGDDRDAGRWEGSLSPGTVDVTGTTIYYMNGTTDYVELFYQAAGTGTLYLNGSSGGTTQTAFWGHLIF